MPFDSTPPCREVQILQKAIEIVEQGWCQGNLFDGRRHCLVGALRLAAGGNLVEVRSEPSYCAVFKAVRQAIDWPREVPLWSWNDRRHRRQSEVIAALRRAVELIEEKAHAV